MMMDERWSPGSVEAKELSLGVCQAFGCQALRHRSMTDGGFRVLISCGMVAVQGAVHTLSTRCRLHAHSARCQLHRRSGVDVRQP